MGKRAMAAVSIFWGMLFAGFPAFAASVPDTGVTKCYDAAGNVITCPNPGQPFYGQDGNYTINPPSYTQLDSSGNGLPVSATSWTMVRDNVTGLIWEVKQDKDGVKNYANPHDADNTYTWYDPDPATNGGNAGTPGDGTDTHDFITALNNAHFGGYSDWRLPGREELRSICDYGEYNPSVNTTYFPHTVSSDYWSSTTYYASSASYAWFVRFNYGGDGGDYKSHGRYVRAVRGGQ